MKIKKLKRTLPCLQDKGPEGEQRSVDLRSLSAQLKDCR